MNLNANKARLIATTKELMMQWEETKDSWRDAKSLEFERQYIEELRISMDAAIGVIDQLDKLVTKIKADCE